MQGRIAGVLAAVGAALAVAAPSAPAAGPRALETILQDDALLLHRPPAQVAATVARLTELGVDRVRLTASWSSLTRDADRDVRPAGFDATDPAAYEQGRFTGIDLAVRELTAAGIRVLVDVGFWAPRWAAKAPDGPRARQDIDPQAFAEFAQMLARRYSGSFVPPVAPAAAPPRSQDQTFLDTLFGEPEPEPAPAPPATGPVTALPRVDQLALWNEPNHPAFIVPTWTKAGARWQPASPHRYRLMVLAAYPAVKAVRPDLKVLVGNTSSTGGRGGGSPVPPLRFLRELACVDGALRPLRDDRCRDFRRIPGDGWAHHPYGITGDPRRTGLPNEPDAVYLGDLPRLRTTLARLTRAGRISAGMQAIHLTEMGYETLDGGPPRGVTQEQQATYLPWSEFEAARVPGVRSFAQFLLRDVPPAATAQSESVRRPLGQFTSGLERTDGTPKLAATAFRAGLHAERLAGGRTLAWVRLRLPGGRVPVVLQRRAARGKVWTTVTRTTVPARGARGIVLRGVPSGARLRVLAGGLESPPVPVAPQRRAARR